MQLIHLHLYLCFYGPFFTKLFGTSPAMTPFMQGCFPGAHRKRLVNLFERGTARLGLEGNADDSSDESADTEEEVRSGRRASKEEWCCKCDDPVYDLAGNKLRKLHIPWRVMRRFRTYPIHALTETCSRSSCPSRLNLASDDSCDNGPSTRERKHEDVNQDDDDPSTCCGVGGLCCVESSNSEHACRYD